MQDSEVAYLSFDQDQARSLAAASQYLADLGGPQAANVAAKAREWAHRLHPTLDTRQQALLQRFADGQLSALMFSQMSCPGNDPLPEQLPDLPSLADSERCRYLAARSQLLLELVRYRAFAFDIDNEGQVVRLVGNFKGGGSVPRADEPPASRVELSSHAGLRLGPHTEAPYNCSVQASAFGTDPQRPLEPGQRADAHHPAAQHPRTARQPACPGTDLGVLRLHPQRVLCQWPGPGGQGVLDAAVRP